MSNKHLIILLTFIVSQNLWAQSVWPGDINNNGVVNKVDLLYLGYAFGAVGSPRDSIDDGWEAKSIPELWSFEFPNGLNFAYADCNGDGLINEFDAQIVNQNVSLSHDDILLIPDLFPVGVAGQDPPCNFINPPATAPVNQSFQLDIGLGDEALPIENLSGLTFKLNVEPDIIGIANASIVFNTDSWIEPDSNQTIILTNKDDLRAEYKIGLTKTNQIPVGGSGSLATVSFVIEDDIIDLLMIDTVTFIIDSILVLDDELQPIPIVSDTLKLKIDRDLMVNTTNLSNIKNSIEVFPNPNSGLVFINSKKEKINRIELINQLGQPLITQFINSNFYTLNLIEFSNQLFWLKTFTESGTHIRLLQKL